MVDFKNLNFSNIADWPKSTKLIAVAVLGIAGLIISLLILILPQYSSLSSARLQELELKQKLVLLAPQVTEQKQQSQQIQQLKKLIELHSQPLPKAYQIGDVLDELTQLTSKSQLDLLYLKPESVQQNEIYAHIPISFQAVGDYFQIANFLRALAHLNYYLYVSKMEINLITDKNNDTKNKKEITIEPNDLKITMTIDLYYFSPKLKEEKAAKKEKDKEVPHAKK